MPERIRIRTGAVPGWRREALRTSLWFVPSLLVLGAIALFPVTYASTGPSTPAP